MSSKELRRFLSAIIDKTGTLLEATAKSFGLDFLSDKSDRRYIELGGSNKIVTFKLWYDSVILKHEAFLKIQINFVEKLLFPPANRTFGSLISSKDHEDLGLFFPEEYGIFVREITFPAYDLREILCEKGRAILTRKGSKARDFVDLFMISQDLHIVPDDFKSEIIEKTVFSLSLYKKYRENLAVKKELFSLGDYFEWGAEKDFLLCEIPMEKFYNFVKDVQNSILKTANEISVL